MLDILLVLLSLFSLSIQIDCSGNTPSKSCLEALWMYASFSYCKSTYITSALLPSSYSTNCSDAISKNVFFYTNIDDAEAFIIKNNRDVYISFAGTDFTSLTDLKADAFSKPSILMGVDVPSGVLNHLNSVYNEVSSCLKSMIPTANTVHIVGHSLGGAMADIATLVLSQDFQNKDLRSYSFNGIDSGSPAFVQKLQSATKNKSFYIYETGDFGYLAPLDPVFCSLRKNCWSRSNTSIRTFCGPKNPFDALLAHRNIYGVSYSCNSPIPVNISTTSGYSCSSAITRNGPEELVGTQGIISLANDTSKVISTSNEGYLTVSTSDSNVIFGFESGVGNMSLVSDLSNITHFSGDVRILTSTNDGIPYFSNLGIESEKTSFNIFETTNNNYYIYSDLVNKFLKVGEQDDVLLNGGDFSDASIFTITSP